MARRLTPDPLQVDPWTEPVRISVGDDKLFFLGFGTTIRRTGILAGEVANAECNSDNATERPCGDDSAPETITDVWRRHGVLRGTHYERGWFNPRDNTISFALPTMPGDLDSFPNWSDIFASVDNDAEVTNDPDFYSLGTTDLEHRTYAPGTWANGINWRFESLVFNTSTIGQATLASVASEINVFQSSDTIELKEVGTPEIEFAFQRRICADEYCTGVGWTWPYDQGVFEQPSFGLPASLKDMALTIRGIEYVPAAVAIGTNSDAFGDEILTYALFFKRKNDPRSVSDLLALGNSE